MLKLTADEILESGNTGLIASYRQSNLTQIMKSSATPSEDKFFINAIEEIYNKKAGVGASSYKEVFDYVSTKSEMTPMDFAVRMSGRLYKSSMQEGLEDVTMRSQNRIRLNVPKI
jgi:hypothetical protein